MSDLNMIYPAEWAAIGVGIFCFVVDFVAMGIALWSRNYPPLKVKQLHLVFFSIVSGAIWWVGALASLRILPQVNNPVFLLCDLWTIWIQIVLGILLWACCLIFRFWKLFVITKLLKKVTTPLFKASFFMFWSPILIFGMFSSIFHVDGPIVDDNGDLICYFNDTAYYVFIALLAIYGITLIGLGLSLRTIKQKYLKEYKETRNITVGFVICYIIYIAFLSTGVIFNIWGRVICSYLVLLCVNLAFWATIGVPLYHRLKDPAEYAERFKNSVRNQSSSGQSESMKGVGSQSQIMTQTEA